jgi:hypothetical protein
LDAQTLWWNLDWQDPSRTFGVCEKGDRETKSDKSPLGPIGMEMLESIYIPCCNKDLESAEKQGLWALKIDYKIEWNGRARQAKMKFKNFIDVRIP